MESHELFEQFRERYEIVKSDLYRKLFSLNPYEEKLGEVAAILTDIFPKDDPKLVEVYIESLKEDDSGILNKYVNGDKNKTFLILDLAIKLALLQIEHLTEQVSKELNDDNKNDLDKHINLLWHGIYLMDVMIF